LGSKGKMMKASIEPFLEIHDLVISWIAT